MKWITIWGSREAPLLRLPHLPKLPYHYALPQASRVRDEAGKRPKVQDLFSEAVTGEGGKLKMKKQIKICEEGAHCYHLSVRGKVYKCCRCGHVKKANSDRAG